MKSGWMIDACQIAGPADKDELPKLSNGEVAEAYEKARGLFEDDCCLAVVGVRPKGFGQFEFVVAFTRGGGRVWRRDPDFSDPMCAPFNVVIPSPLEEFPESPIEIRSAKRDPGIPPNKDHYVLSALRHGSPVLDHPDELAHVESLRELLGVK